MCGIFGIQGHDEAANIAYLGLHSLQHRGQESAGLVAGDQVLHRRVGMGLVSDIFDRDTLATLPGRAAIGHVRYSTAGSSELRNAQPFLFDYVGGSVAIAHNGNLVNATTVRTRLEHQGSIFQTTSDSEVIVHLMAQAREHDTVSRLIAALRQVEGAYSLVLLTNDQLIGARDPHGFRPLVIGRVKDAYVLSSETSSFDLIEAEYIREVEPGEVVVIEKGGLTSHRIGPAAPTALLRLRARLLRPARQPAQRQGGLPGPREDGGAPGPGGAAGRRRRHPGARLGRARRDRLRQGERHPVRDGPHPVALRRPHLHRAPGLDPPLRRPAQAVAGPRRGRRQAGGGRRRLAGPRHDLAQDRQDAARGRGQGGPHADQRAADHALVLLRHRHPDPVGAGRGLAHRSRRSRATSRATRWPTCRTRA